MNITVSYEIGKSQIENFEGLVSEVFRSVLEIGRELIRETLEQADETLMENRDRERYRCKGFQKTCIKSKRSVWFPPMCVSLRRRRFAVLLTVVRPG